MVKNREFSEVRQRTESKTSLHGSFSSHILSVIYNFGFFVSIIFNTYRVFFESEFKCFQIIHHSIVLQRGVCLYYFVIISIRLMVVNLM